MKRQKMLAVYVTEAEKAEMMKLLERSGESSFSTWARKRLLFGLAYSLDRAGLGIMLDSDARKRLAEMGF
jgi:hypothetical protein